MITKYFLKSIARASFLSVIKFKIPLIQYDAGVSPGWTLAVISITGLLALNLTPLTSFGSGNNLSLIFSSRMFNFPSWEEIV